MQIDKIKDLAGVRLIFYFEDDLDYLCTNADRFKSWFGRYSSDNLTHIVGGPGSAETRDPLPGYDSFHVPVSVSAGTAFWRSLKAIDRQQLESMQCEVQLRTILRHAWAEAEHDLRYKVRKLTDYPLSQETNRSFVQLATSVADTDTKLVKIKSDMEAVLEHLMPKTAPPQQSWIHKQPVCQPAFSYRDVAYDYELLHAPGAVSDVPAIKETAGVFELDRVMRDAVSIDRYKHKMWERLKVSEPQFVSSIQFDSTVARVCGWNPEKTEIVVQPARYSDQVVTNHKKALTKMIPGGDGRIVRELAFDRTGKLLPFESSPLSNTLGVGCVARVDKRFWIGALRASSVAFDPGMWGCSASGALEWTELGHWDSRDFDGWFKGGMVREFEEELGYSLDKDALHYLGFARELGRAGKPQLFFFVDIEDFSSEDFESLWRTYTSPGSEYEELRFFDDKAANALISVDEAAIQQLLGSAGLSEEFRMNLALAIRYVELGRR